MPCIIPSVTYDYLQRNMIIDFAPEMREQFKAQAKQELHAEKLEEKFTDRTSDAINRYILALDNQNNTDVINRGKAIAVKHWFEFIITSESDINELLTPKTK